MIALTAIKPFLSKFAIPLTVGFIALLCIGAALWQFKEASQAEVRADVLQETIETSNSHVRIEEKQSEIYNRTLSDDELFDSLQSRTF